MQGIQMVDLRGQYLKIKNEIDSALKKVIDSTNFINGEEVKLFEKNLSEYLNVKHVITCANGTDALQVALMSLDLEEGDEVISPDFTFIATVESIALLKLKPILADVYKNYFTIDTKDIKNKITKRTKAIIPVHLFGQSADMNEIMQIAKEYNLKVIEDNAQALGADFISEGFHKKLGTIGDIGCTSFFPSKNLGCYGDGGAVFTNDDYLAEKIRMLVNHGSNKKYFHKIIGVNSRLDSIQAAILNIKLKYLNNYIELRRSSAMIYDQLLSSAKNINIPLRNSYSNHVFHQYTISLNEKDNRMVQEKLKNKGIPSMIYYPLPMHKQEALKGFIKPNELFPVSDLLSDSVLSLPMHTELQENEISYICENVLSITKNLS